MTLGGHQLTTELHVKNTATSNVGSSDALEFQALLHNYIRAPSKEVIIGPLKQVSYYDKTETTEKGQSTAKVETRAAVDVKTYTDFVYENAGEKYEVKWPGDRITISSSNFKDVVVWNPQDTGRNMSDMEDNGWCVKARSSYVHSAEHVVGSDMYAWSQAMFEALLSLNRDKIGWDIKFLKYLIR